MFFFYREVDQDSDGRISFNEFESAMKYGQENLSHLIWSAICYINLQKNYHFQKLQNIFSSALANLHRIWGNKEILSFQASMTCIDFL